MKNPIKSILSGLKPSIKDHRLMTQPEQRRLHCISLKKASVINLVMKSKNSDSHYYSRKIALLTL